LRFSDKQASIAKLAAGEYRLVVEAAREVGGREMIEIPFRWPMQRAERLEARGEHELGAVTLTLQP
jgi:hypothetical protein